MSVLVRKLEQFQNEEVVIVMQDNRAFRGRLVEFDVDAVVLRDVVEGVPSGMGGWEEPTVSTGIVEKVVTWNGTFSHADDDAQILRLKDVVIRTAGILRIWEFDSKNVVAPAHTGRVASEVTQARRVSRRA